MVADLVADANAARPVTAGGTGETTARLKDGTWRFQNTADTTKLLAFDLSGLTTATTRTLTVPDVSGALVLNAGAQTVGGLKDFTTNPKVSGGGLQFPATQVPSSDVNVLDDYEEGTWTPADGSGAALSLTAADAQYVKIGQMVFLTANITYPATANGNNAVVSGLPFTSYSTSGSQYGGAPSLSSIGTAFSILVTANATNMVFFDLSGTRKTNADFTSAGFRFSIMYRASA